MAAFLEAELPSQPTPELQDSVAVNHEERTKLFNAGKMLDPVVQKAAKKCQYCQTELKGPCASQFSDLYKCAVTKGDKHITSPNCARHIYVQCMFPSINLNRNHSELQTSLILQLLCEHKCIRSCVEEDYTIRQTQCPMYMTFLRQNITNSPCGKQLKMMNKMCRNTGSRNRTSRPGNSNINSICRNATNELRRCVSMTKSNYGYMHFWENYDGDRGASV